MKNINWKKSILVSAVASLVLAGTLAVGTGAFAQSTTPPTTGAVPSTQQQVLGGHRGGHGGAGLAAAAKALGMDEAALRTELQAGKTIADVAKAKGVDLSVVSSAILADEKTKVAQQVTDGKITQAQADAKLATAQTRITDMLNGKLPVGGSGDHGGKGGNGIPSTTVVAKALGMDEAALKTELQAGKTIADVAKAKNVDVAVVLKALVDDEKTELAQAVKDGTLTQAQADAKLVTEQTRFTDMLNGKVPVGGPGKRGPKLNGTPATNSPVPTPLPGA